MRLPGKSLPEETKSQEPIEAPHVTVVNDGDIEMGDLPVANVQQEAVPLTPRAAGQLEAVPIATVANVPGIVVERIKERPKQCCAGFGCFVVLITFLIAFLFIPRAPNVSLRRVEGLANDDLRVSVKFTSKTLIDATWRRLEVDLEWSDGSSRDVATLMRSSSFKTDAFGHKNIVLTDFESTNARLPLASLCAVDGSAILRVRGHIRTDDTRFRIESDWTQTSCS